MKICAILTCFTPNTTYGGPVQSRTHGFNELTRRGHSITVLTSNIIDEKRKLETTTWTERQNGFDVIRFRSAMPVRHFSGILSLEMLRWINMHGDRFDVFHVSYARELIPVLAVRALHKLNARVILQPHGMLDRSDGIRKLIDRLVTDRQLTKSDAVICLQENERNGIEKRDPRIRTRIIPNGIDLEVGLPKWGGPNREDPVILFLARLHPRKNLRGFIRAAALLHESNRALKFRVVGPDGGDRDSAMRLAQDLGLGKAVEFIGPVSRVEALQEFARASVYVLPSFNEPFANTITEALAIGTPVVLTTSTRNLALLERYDAAEISDHFPESLARSIGFLIDHPERSSALSRNGLELVRNELDIKKSVDLVENLYREVADGRV